jgi:hypothetical protein
MQHRSCNPHILINQVRLSGESDSLIFGGYYLGSTGTTQKLTSLSPLHFSSSNSSFHFEFSSPIFASQANITYRYRLKGYEREWSAPTIKTEKEYTNLPQGDYTFEARYPDLGLLVIASR